MQSNLHLTHSAKPGIPVYKYVNSGPETFTIYFLPLQNFVASYIKLAEDQKP